MKVLHILGSIERSGAESMLYDAVPRFAQEGIVCEVVATGETIGPRAEAFESRGVHVHHLPFEKSPAFFTTLMRLVRDSGCDVVHVHTERAAVWIEASARAAGHARLVRTVHGHFQPHGWLRMRRRAGRWFACRVLGVQHVFVSPSVAENERTWLGCTGVLIPNGVDTAAFTPARSSDEVGGVRDEFGLPHESVVVVTVGSCAEVKQHGHVVQALVGLRHVAGDVRYLHVGDGPLGNAEQQLASDLGVQDVCIFVGSRDDVPRLLRACDIFAMTSQREALGLSAVEAAACGLPVVAYDVPGLRDVVEHEVSGLLVEPTAAALERGIARLVADTTARGAMGAAGRRRVVRQYSAEQWASRHVALYRGDASQGWGSAERGAGCSR